MQRELGGGSQPLHTSSVYSLGSRMKGRLWASSGGSSPAGHLQKTHCRSSQLPSLPVDTDYNQRRKDVRPGPQPALGYKSVPSNSYRLETAMVGWFLFSKII